MSDLLTEALAAAQRRQAELLPILRTWVTTNSFSENIDGVNAVGQQLIEAFDLPGLSVERRAGHGVGDHLCWRSSGWQDSQDGRVLLIGHHDTVFPPGTFERWEQTGDSLHGPGVLDMKGGLAVIRTALAAISDTGGLGSLPVAFVSVGDEEIGSTDSRGFVESVARGASAGLVFEAGRARDQIITQRKGTGRFGVEVSGVAAHAGNHHADGVNAIRALARFVDRVEALTDYDRGITVNVGTITGGTSANTVPARASCQIDFRFIRGVDGQELVGVVDRLARDVAAETRATFVIGGGVRRPPLERSDASVELYRRYAACAEVAGLEHDECALIGGGSDANNVSALGVPCIDGLGPRGSGFHTHDEVIAVSTLSQRVEALVRFLVAGI